jgi:hypothetical protein
MSDVPTSTGARGATDPLYTPPSDSTSGSGKAGQVAQAGGQAAQQAASDVKDTAAEQARRVAGEAKSQVRGLASDVRDRVGEQARTQNDKLVGTIRDTADQLDQMRGDRVEGPAATVVSRVADSGRQLADYLEHHGPEGVLREVQDFARRRPGAFLATALAAGFVVGRLGKSVAKADGDAGTSAQKPRTDSFVSREPDPYASPETLGYATGAGTATTGTYATEYAATGTGTPEVVTEEYVGEGYGTPPAPGYSGGVR